jgi:hypothetical protein
MARIATVLARVPDAQDIADNVPANVNFGSVADATVEAARRIDALHDIAERVGTSYSPACLATCGNALFCRARAFRAGALCLTGPETVRGLPGVRSIGRAAELTDGAPATAEEAPVAAHLAKAGRLYDAVVRTSPASRARRSA